MRSKALLGQLLVGLGCTTTTTLHSTPEGAKVYIDGVYRGDTPLTLALPDGSDNGYKHLRLEKDGFAATESAISRRQDGFRLVCGYFCLVPLLWVYKWDDSYTVPLLREGELPATPKGGFAPPPPSSSGTQL